MPNAQALLLEQARTEGLLTLALHVWRPWQARGACRGMDRRIFMPANGRPSASNIELAKATCARCPVRRQCLAFTMHEEANTPGRRVGVVGGLTGTEREQLATHARVSEST